MRIAFTLSCLLCLVGVVRAEEAASKPIAWGTPFQSVSASTADNHLTVIVITNDTYPDQARSATDVEAESKHQPIWCESVLSQSVRSTLKRRPGLSERLALQFFTAGLPVKLTGGENRNLPARAIVAICDRDYRLLGFRIGVPSAEEFQSLVEDAEEVRSIRQLNADEPTQGFQAIADRSIERLTRFWQTPMRDLAGAFVDEESDGDAPDRSRSRLKTLGEAFDPIYLADVKLRFGLVDASDQNRLIALEQHTQTKLSWCESMTPFLAGCDFEGTWRPLMELLWGHQPVTQESVDQAGQSGQADLLAWYDSQKETDAVVISLKPTLRLDHFPWPPIMDETRGMSWVDAHAEALRHPFRQLDLQQLAVFWRERKMPAVDLFRPTLARYVLLQPNKGPVLIRQGEPPARFANLLKKQ
ncbi:MAG: hypothetical protein AB8B91_09730 [Rubripirellula sp.]